MNRFSPVTHINITNNLLKQNKLVTSYFYPSLIDPLKNVINIIKLELLLCHLLVPDVSLSANKVLYKKDPEQLVRL